MQAAHAQLVDSALFIHVQQHSAVHLGDLCCAATFQVSRAILAGSGFGASAHFRGQKQEEFNASC